ncbi:hypothetical protein CBS101457_004308 [Exobasidium rhododendri]|nr:hypothetical protein CBS101457_004308 [Exobasidium rhododendri]
MKRSPIAARTSLFHSAPANTHDAISTSSSTLLNPESEEVLTRRRRKHGKMPPSFSMSNGRTMTSQDATKEGLFTSDGWLKTDSETYHRSGRREEIPDDHRCSDQETNSGLCRCTVDGNNDSTSSETTLSESSQQSTGIRNETDRASYDQQLLLARRKKLLSDAKNAVIDDNNNNDDDDDQTVMRPAEAKSDMIFHQSPGSRSRVKSSLRERDLQSDPVLARRTSTHQYSSAVPSQAYQQQVSSSSDEEQDWPHGASVPNRRWASSPIDHSNHPMSSSPSTNAARRRLKISASRSALNESSKQQDSPLLNATGASTSVAAPPSAARNSISNVFEKLLKEENERRQEERMKKEAARERRRLEKKRREEEEERRMDFEESYVEPEKPEEGQRREMDQERSNSMYDGERSFSRDVEDTIKKEESYEEDQVTMGSDFQGQAPLQSTPPRASPLPPSKPKNAEPFNAEKKSEASPLHPRNDDSLRRTLQQLRDVLHKVNNIESDTGRLDIVSPTIETSHFTRDISEQMVKRPFRKSTNEKANDLDDAYVEKIGTIRKRLQRMSSRPKGRVAEQRSSARVSRRGWFITVALQFALVWLMMLASEHRARQLFLTTFHDPFQPHDFLDMPPVTAGGVFAPLLAKWDLVHHPMSIQYTSNDGVDAASYSSHHTWLKLIAKDMRHLVHGQSAGQSIKALVVRTVAFLGLDSSDDLRGPKIVPT